MEFIALMVMVCVALVALPRLTVTVLAFVAHPIAGIGVGVWMLLTVDWDFSGPPKNSDVDWSQYRDWED